MCHLRVSLPLLTILWRICTATNNECQLTPTRFRTNNLKNPLAIASDRPVFSWALEFLDGGYEPPTGELGVDHHQTAYQITCIEKGNRNLLWDSGKVQSRETLQIEYDGIPLQSLQRIEWHVRVWDENGNECPAKHEDPWFETGLLPNDDKAWGGAEFIARHGSLPPNVTLCSMMAPTDENQVPRFRATFKGIPASVVAARAYIVGLGYYQLHINGERVGDAMLDTAWTTYSKRVLYATHDVTLLLKYQASSAAEGTNAIGVELGNGWWNPLPLRMFRHQNLRESLIEGNNITSSRPMFRLHLVGFKEDGSSMTILTSEAGSSSPWRAASGPTTFNNIYLGEIYDARLEPSFDGWTTPCYFSKDKPSAWEPTILADSSGIGRLEAQELPPIRKQKTLSSKRLSISTANNGDYVMVVDTGVNHAGSCQIRVNQQTPEASGAKIVFKYGELLFPNGTLNVLTSVAGHIIEKNPDSPCQPDVAAQQDSLLIGSRAIEWTPSWSWHGFRYIEVAIPSSVNPHDVSIECFTMRTDVDVIATFNASDSWLAKLRQLVRNTYESNMMGVQSDCPHRERFGYGGDVLGCGEAGLSMYDFSAFYRKRVLDYNDAQVVLPSGELAGFTETSPFVGIQTAGLGPKMGPIGWETFQPESLLWLYKYYGDTRTMKESFNHTLAYIHLLESEPKSIEAGLGDWLAVDSTDVAFTGRGFQFMSYLAFANMSELLENPPAIASRYRKKAADLVEQINSRFLDASGTYAVGSEKRGGKSTQTGQGMALFQGFLSANQTLRKNALLELAANIRASSFLEGACQVQDIDDAPRGCKNARGGEGPHLTAGLFGLKWVCMALSDGGFNDLAYDAVSTRSFPGLGWMMDNPFANATTIWESFWFSDQRRSHNHPMFSASEVWLIQSVAGIQPHPSSRGMNHILIKPNPPSKLSSVSASFESPRGVTTVSWRRENVLVPSMYLNVSIPPNTRATIYVPSQKSSEVWHNGFLAPEAPWEAKLADENLGTRVFSVGSGRHEFKSMPSKIANSR